MLSTPPVAFSPCRLRVLCASLYGELGSYRRLFYLQELCVVLKLVLQHPQHPLNGARLGCGAVMAL